MNALVANISGVSLTAWLLVQFFGFFFWIGMVLWAVNGNIASFFNVVAIARLIQQKPMLLIGNYIQQFIAGIIVYVLATVSVICICLPFLFIPFYLYVYGYVTGKTAQALDLRAAKPEELPGFKGDF